MSARVTVFITTIGASTFERCLHAVLDQEGKFFVDVIQGVAPWSAAQNEMVRRCNTEIFVQVDEDMILFNDALLRLVALIDSTPATCVMATAPLYDVDLEMPIYGVKVYRHALVKPIPFETHVLGDGHDRERWKEAGLTWSRLRRSIEHCVGEHGTSYTPEEAFNRWRGMWQRHRLTGKASWIEPWVEKLARRYEKSKTRRDLYALLGAVIGATEEPWPDGHGPDFTRPNPVLERLQTVLAVIPRV
jgi:hypothetical protein